LKLINKKFIQGALSAITMVSRKYLMKKFNFYFSSIIGLKNYQMGVGRGVQQNTGILVMHKMPLSSLL